MLIQRDFQGPEMEVCAHAIVGKICGFWKSYTHRTALEAPVLFYVPENYW